jgi:hypothetical protein
MYITFGGWVGLEMEEAFEGWVALDLIFCVFHGLAEFCDCRRRQKKSVFLWA